MKKLVIINGSPTPDERSNTYQALMAEKEWFEKQCPDLEVVYVKLPRDMRGCKACKTCVQGCKPMGDNFKEIISHLTDATDVLLGSPVHLDMPSTQTVALLTRLNCMAESTGRRFFEGKRLWALATGYCSGTKTCIRAIHGAAEMLGLTIPGRSSREWIVKWDDKKLRGGLRQEESVCIEKKY